MIYLASPYAHPDMLEMDYRFHSVCRAVVCLMKQGEVVYSPIAHNHYLAQTFDLPRDWDFWSRFDLPMIDKADSLWVLMLDGWQKSKGVQAEIAHAINTGKPVLYIELDEVCSGENN